MKRNLLILFVSLIFMQHAIAQTGPCVGSQSLTANPPPAANGTYLQGTTVNFCYSVTNYAQNGVDWLAGAAITLGPAWNASTLTPVTIPASCDGLGAWGFYNSCTGTASGQTWGPGFYYDSPSGGPFDGIPGNNYGDNCQSHTWTFCFSVQVGPCPATGSGSLYVGVRALSDYSAGSWGTNSCQDNPASTQATIQCNCNLTVTSINQTDATCANSNDGSITAVPSGVAPYTYLWNTGATTATINNLAAGVYTVTVTDANNCTKTVTFPVGAPPPIVLNETVVDNDCSAGTVSSITLAPSGGTAPYSYQWSTGATTSFISNLAAGTYTVDVIDGNGCTESGTFTISPSTPLDIAVTSTPTGCTGDDGTATVTVNTGLAPFTYDWQPSGGTGATETNLTPGTYTVLVTDANGCSATETVTIVGPPPIVLNETIVDNQCTVSDGSISLAPTGGSGSGYTYQWSDGTTGSTISSLQGGTYTVTVTDDNGCTTSSTFTISTFDPLVLTTTSTSTSCNGTDGTATVSVTGGTAPYTYDWQPAGGNGATATNLPGGTYTVLVTDANGCTSTDQVTVQQIIPFTLSTSFVPLVCDPQALTSATVNVTGGAPPFTYQWTPIGGNGQTANNLPAGMYTVIVTDANNCVDSALVDIPTVVPVTLTSSTTPVQCNQPNSGTASVTASGGTAPYTYLWSDGSTSASAGNLAGGTYSVTVTDANGCTAVETVVVSVIPDVFASAGSDQSVCNGDPANLSGSASGGTAPFSYSWNNGVNNANQTVTPSITTTYVITVTDANGCTASASVNVNVIDYPVVTVTPDQDICYGASTTLTATGGSTYSWAPTGGLSDPNISNPVANPVNSTTYTVTVSNAMCSSTGTVTVNVASPITAAFSPDTTQGQPPLTVNFTNNSTGSDTYIWDFGDGNTSTDSDPTHTYTQQGTYIVELISINSLGCSDTVRYSFIIVDSKSLLIVPNVFTPNNDGFNDTFHFQEEGISSIDVVIMNRWGKEVYSWNKPYGSWDGKSKDGTELPDGVYVYLINAKGVDGKSYKFDGTVQLIRNKK